MKLLFVDDDLNHLKLMSKYLSEHFEVIQKGSAEDALGYIHDNRVDVVLTDICMSPMNGLTFVRKLRLQGFRKPIIVQSTLSAEKDALQAGANGFLQKPWRVEDLLHLLPRHS